MKDRSQWMLAVAVAIAVAASGAEGCNGPTATVTQGQICGTTTSDYVRYLGIPYAEPPSGPLRFKNPVPKSPWQGVRTCNEQCSKCLQAILTTPLTEGSEDCLCLNVYVPKKPEIKPIPVMVWIHGGAFTMGSGNNDVYNPKDLVNEGVIVVTLNYRLGTLGFLCFKTEDAPGNQGLKDQVMALRWVKDNIKAFGGDPEQVTIFGESAGSVSVHLHTLSPMSRGLFQRAIAQSGSALNPWGFNRTTECSNAVLLKKAKCPVPKGSDTSATFECLRKIPGKSLQAPTSAFVCAGQDESGGMMAFTPCLDGEFLPDEPVKLAANCDITSNISMIVGYNSAEGILSLLSLRLSNGYSKWTKLIASGRGLAQPGTNCSHDAAQISRWGKRASQHFLGGQPLSLRNEQAFVNYATFFSFTWGIDLGINWRVNCSNAKPQYLYLFDVATILNHAKQLCGGIMLKGAAHADELYYVFNADLDKYMMIMPSDAKMAKERMVKLWTNFGKCGNPTPKTDGRLITSVWEPYSAKEKNYLHINNKGIKESKKPFEKDTAFYEGLCSTC